MWCNIIPCVLNGVLDWVFIFPLDMGVKGAAIATGISIAIGGIMTLGYLLFFSHRLRPARVKWSRKSINLSLRNIGYQCRIGSASLLGELTLAVLTFVGNLTFMHYLGDDGVGAFGIACYYSPFFFMIGNAVAQSAQPIISYDFGTGRHHRIRQALRLVLITASGFAALVIVGFVLFPEPLTALFVNPQDTAGRLAIEGFPYYATGILFYILNIALTGYYQSLENMRRATLIVSLRTVLLIPSFVLLPLWLGTPGIWLAMPMTEMLTLAVVAITKVTAKKSL
jgi:Na+-driven multidrug efflux pump